MLHLVSRQLTYASSAGDEQLLVALNLADTEVEQPAPQAREVLAGTGTLRRPGMGDTTVQLPAHGWAVLATVSRR